MASVPEVDLRRITEFCDKRVPGHLRHEARLEPQVRGRLVTIVDCRPPWHPGDAEWSRVPIAQLRFDPASGTWTLHWSDPTGRWHLYDLIEPGTAQQMIEELDEDPTCTF